MTQNKLVFRNVVKVVFFPSRSKWFAKKSWVQQNGLSQKRDLELWGISQCVQLVESSEIKFSFIKWFSKISWRSPSSRKPWEKQKVRLQTVISRTGKKQAYREYAMKILSECKLSDDGFEGDTLFKSEAARRFYLIFKKLDVCKSAEFSLLSIARLEAIVACVVDGLQGQSEGRRTGTPSQSAIQAVEDFDCFSFPASAEK